MYNLKFVELDDIDEDKWIPTEQDFVEFLKEYQDELEYYKSENFIPYEGRIESLEKDIKEFNEADLNGKVKLIRFHVFCYAEVCPIESFSSLWKRVLGLEKSI